MINKLLATVFLTMVFGVLTTETRSFSEYCDPLEWKNPYCESFLIPLKNQYDDEKKEPLEKFCSTHPNLKTIIKRQTSTTIDCAEINAHSSSQQEKL